LRFAGKPSAKKELKKLEPSAIEKIIIAIEKLIETPYPQEVKKIQGMEHTYRKLA